MPPLLQNIGADPIDTIALQHDNSLTHEIRDKRSWNVKHYTNGNGNVAVVSGKWAHYLNELGEWDRIDCTMVINPAGFSMDKAPFAFSAPKFATGQASFTSNVRFDIHTDTNISEAPVSMEMRAMDVSAVAGELFDMNNDGVMDSVLYPNAYPQWNADLIYYVNHARAPRLEKLIRFNAAPPAGINPVFQLTFNKSYSMSESVVTEADIAQLKSNDRLSKQDMRVFYEQKESVIATEKRTYNPIVVRPTGSMDIMRGIGMRDFYIWDSNPDGVKRSKIDVTVQRRGLTLNLTKHIPDAFFTDAVFPVYTDASSTFYPDPNTETTSVDGHIGYFTGATWSEAHDAATGTDVFDSSTSAIIDVEKTATARFGIYRTALLFDTSSIDDSVTVDSATLSIYVSAKTNNQSDAYDYLNVVSANPASNTALTTADYDTFGTTKYASDIDYSAITTSAYNTFTFNATGEAAISLTGISKFAVREGNDIEDVAYAGGTSTKNSITIATADTGGTSQDPKLIVVYFNPPADPSGLTATPDGTDIDLSWTDNSSNEDGFDIEVSDTGGGSGFSLLASVGAGVTTYTHSVGTYSTTKYYRVKATNSTEGDSGYTSEASATTVPQAPSGLSVTATTASQDLDLSWTDNSSDETTFRIERSDDGVSGWSEIANVGAGVTTYTDANVGWSTTRHYRVRALRSGDSQYSGYSNSDSALTAPAAPSGVTAASVLDTSLSLEWTDNSTDETQFNIERKQGSGAYSEIDTDTASPYADSGLVASTSYTYRVRAYRASDGFYSPYSTEFTLTTSPTAPVNLSAFCVSDVASAAKVLLRWQPSSILETGTKIERRIGAGSWSTVTTTAAGIGSYTDTSLTENTTYEYRISSFDGTYYSPTLSASVTTTRGTVNELEHNFLKKINNFQP